jgi:hypothetical protein
MIELQEQHACSIKKFALNERKTEFALSYTAEALPAAYSPVSK